MTHKPYAAICSLAGSVLEHFPGKDIGNGNWWGRQYHARGWMVQVRIRRERRRQTYRKWLTIQAFNYNYSEEAKQKSREQQAIHGGNTDGE